MTGFPFPFPLCFANDERTNERNLANGPESRFVCQSRPLPAPRVDFEQWVLGLVHFVFVNGLHSLMQSKLPQYT